MGRSEPEGEKERELARMTTMVIAAGRREGRQANDRQTFNENRIEQAKTGLFIQNLCETEHPCRRLRAHGNFYPWIPKRFGAFVRDGPSENRFIFIMSKTTTLHGHHAFLQCTTSTFSWTSIKSFRIQLHKQLPTFDELNENRRDKFEASRLYI